MSLLSLLLVAVSAPAPPTESIVAKGAHLQLLADGFAFTEGPADDRKGDVYFTDQPNDRILKWSPNGQVQVWMTPCGRANGMAFDKKGNLIACADEKNQLWSISPDQKVTVLVNDYRGHLLNGPNDVWIRPDGGMYITDPLYARPYWTRDPKSQLPGQYVFFLPKGANQLTPVATDLKVPNGIIGTPDGKLLYVGDLGSNATFRYRIEKDGTLADKTQYCNLGSDGMTMDALGDVYLSGKGVTVFDKEGKQIEHIDVPQDWVGHVAFGGKDHRTLFITASRAIYGLQMRVRGAY